MAIRSQNRSVSFSKNLIRGIYAIAVFYTVFNLGGIYLGIPSIAYQIIFSSAVLAAFLFTLRLPLHNKISFLILCALPFVGFNIYYSIDFQNSAIYWLFWLLFLISLLKIAQNLSKNHFENLLSHLPYVLLIASVLLLIILWPRINESLPTKNSLGILSGATLIAATTLKNKYVRIIVIITSLWILNKSDSRSSLAFALAIFGLHQLINFKVKYLGAYVLLIILLVTFQGNIFSFVEQKMLKKDYFATNLQEAIESGYGERTLLLKEGWKIFKERPVTGYGLKTDYQKGRISIAKGHFTGVHNGYLESLIEVGLFIFFFIGIIIFKISSGILKHLLSRGNNSWVLFLLFGLLRGYGESYLYFNIGNVFSVIFLFLTIVMITRPELLLGSKKNNYIVRRKAPVLKRI